MVKSNDIRPEESAKISPAPASPTPVGIPEAAPSDQFQQVATNVITQMNSGRPETTTPSSGHGQGRLRTVGLRAKATLAALLIGTVPVAAIGGIAVNLAGKALERQSTEGQLSRTNDMADKINRFMFERFGDIQVIGALPTFTDPAVREITSLESKQALLEDYRTTYGVYTSIAAFDLKGDVIAQSTAGAKLENHFDRDYIQAVLKTGKPYVSQPKISKTNGDVSIYFSAPIRDKATNEMIGVMRSRMPITALTPLLELYSQGGEEYHLADASGQFFAALESEQVGRQLNDDFPKIIPLVQEKRSGTAISIDNIDNVEQLVAYAPFQSLEGLQDLNWSAVIGVDTNIIFATQRQLLTALLLGTGAVAALVALVAVYLATQATRPVIQAASVVEQIGRGELDARLAVPEQGDELVQLGQNINQMGSQLQSFFAQQASDAQLSQILGDLARVRDQADLPVLLDQVMHEVQRRVQGDRVLFQRITQANGSGSILAEAVLPTLRSTRNQSFAAPSANQLAALRDQQTLVLNKLSQGDLSLEQEQQLQNWQVQSLLSSPVFVNEELYGLVTIHSCNQARAWTTEESEFVRQFGDRLALSLTSVEAYQTAQTRAQEERQQKEALQRELIGLLSDVEGASSGDLTVRAQITAGEIGIVADFFNAIVENLRDVVTEVKLAAGQVNTSVTTSGQSIRKLASETQDQAFQVKETLVSVEQMTTALQTVATKAREAAQTTQQAELTAQAGGQAMEKTVGSIQQVRETVAETAKKVKRLGESSQQISKVIELINQIALKTNLLAVNAGIEAARAGEEGRGFAVVAEEVGALAAQSAVATKEIEQIIASIQQGTSEVVEAMETSTTQVVEGTRSVEEAKQSLTQILKASQQVNQVFQMISKETIDQADTSKLVQQLMSKMAAVSEAASTDSQKVSQLLEETVQVAQRLQTSVSTFKIEAA